MILKSVKNDDKILRAKIDYVLEVTDSTRKILDSMVEFCEIHSKPKTLSLAANQVGINQRLIVIFDNKEILKLVNPKIIAQKGKQIFFEGCVNANLPDKLLRGFVERPAYIKVEALDYNGQKITIEADKILAIMLCHEIDHLNGILFTDKLIGEPYLFDTAEEVDEFRLHHPLVVIEDYQKNN